MQKVDEAGMIESKFKGDEILLMIYFGFLLISVVEVFSASSMLVYKTGNHIMILVVHATHLVAGAACMWVAQMVQSKWYRLAPVFMLVAWILLMFVLVFGDTVNGANRWLFATELAKICTIISTALILSKTQTETYAMPVAFKYVLIITCITFLLIVPENLSTALILGLSVFLMMFYGMVRTVQIMKLMATVIFTVSLFVIFARSVPDEVLKWMDEMPGLHRVSTWVHRVNSFMDGSEEKVYDVYGDDAQRIYADLAIKRGSLLGKGPGNSYYTDYLPQAYSDMIFAIIVEETGLVGATVVILMYIILFVRTGRIANKSPSTFTSLMVLGLASMLVIQAFVNMFVAVGIIPITGQPLPLISRGGNSILSSSIIFGVIIGASRATEKRVIRNKKENENERIEEHER